MANVFDYIFNIGGNFSAQISGMSAATEISLLPLRAQTVEFVNLRAHWLRFHI